MTINSACTVAWKLGLLQQDMQHQVLACEQMVMLLLDVVHVRR